MLFFEGLPVFFFSSFSCFFSLLKVEGKGTLLVTRYLKKKDYYAGYIADDRRFHSLGKRSFP